MGRRSQSRLSLPPNVTAYIDRHGKARFRYRKTGRPSYEFKGDPGTAKNPSAEYRALAAGKKPQTPAAPPGTIRDLINRFYSTSAFTNPGPVTHQKVRARLEAFCAKHGTKRVTTIRFNHVEAILADTAKPGVNAAGKRIGGPNAAKSLEKDLVKVFDLAVKLELINTNPVRLADGVKVPKTSGYHSWEEHEIDQFRAKFPVGTKGRLAIEIILWTLQRRGDASRFGPKHRRGGMIHIFIEKSKKMAWLPEPHQLTAAIEAMPAVGLTTFIVTEFGKPFTPAGFGNWFRDRCDEAGLPHCSAHGLRKATARRLAELGASQQQLKAAGSWAGDKEVTTYTAAADQKRLADQAMTDLSARENQLGEVRQIEQAPEGDQEVFQAGSTK